MRLGTKIIIGFICISLLLAFIGIISDRYTNDIRQEQLRYVNNASKVVVYTGEMERSLFQSLIYLNGIREATAVEDNYNTVQEFPAAVELQNKFEDELEQFDTSFANLQQILGEDEQLPEDLNELVKSFDVYKSISREWLSLDRENSSQANRMFINSIEPYFRNNIIPEITQLRNYVLSVQEKQNATLNTALEKATLINYVATSLSVLFAIVLAVYIYRSIANPLSKVSSTAKKLGEGNLDERIKVSSKDEIGELANSINTMAANLQKSTVSKAYLDNILESIQEALFVADTNGKLVRVNSAGANLLGYEVEEMINKPIDHFYNFREMSEVYKKNSTLDHSFEFSLIKKNDESIPVLLSEAELLDNLGNKVGSVSVASDISERKKTEEEIRSSLKEKEVMLAEIHHRVKNNLAVISGMLQLQSFKASSAEVEQALSDSQMRVQSIALVHEMLYESESLAYIKYDRYIKDLLQAIKSMHTSDERNISLVAEVEPVSLSISQAIPCSLLVNELVVNAFKHAFTNGEDGEITVRLAKKDQEIILTIADNGKGFEPEKFSNSDSLGVSLIKTLTKQLQGTFEIEDNTNSPGSIFRIQFDRDY